MALDPHQVLSLAVGDNRKTFETPITRTGIKVDWFGSKPTCDQGVSVNTDKKNLVNIQEGAMRKDSLFIFAVSIVLTLGIVGGMHYLYLQKQKRVPNPVSNQMPQHFRKKTFPGVPGAFNRFRFRSTVVRTDMGSILRCDSLTDR